MPKYSEEYWEKRNERFLNWLREHPDAIHASVLVAGFSDVLQKIYNNTLSDAKTEALGEKFEKGERYSQEDKIDIVDKFLFTSTLKELRADAHAIGKWCEEDYILEKVAERRNLPLETVKKIEKFRSDGGKPFQVVLQAFKLLKEGMSQREASRKLNLHQATISWWKRHPLVSSVVKEIFGDLEERMREKLKEKLKFVKQYFETALSMYKFPIAYRTLQYWLHHPRILSHLLDEYELKDKIFLEEDLKEKIHPKKIGYFIKWFSENNLIYPVGRFYTTSEELAKKLAEKTPRRKKRKSYGWIGWISWGGEDKEYRLEDITNEKLGEFERKHIHRKISIPSRKTVKVEKVKRPTIPPAIMKLIRGELKKEEMEKAYNARTVIATQRLFRRLEKELHEPILDLGCGPTSPVLRATDKHVICLDKSKEHLKFLKEKNRGKNADYIQADATYLPFRNVPTITITYLLSGMRKEDAFNLLVEAKKALSEDGRIYIETCAHMKGLKDLETLLKLMKYDYRKIPWKTKLYDGTSTRSHLIMIPSYTYEEIKHEFVSFLERDKVVFLKEGKGIRHLPLRRVNIREVEHLVKKPEYKVDNALEFMSEVYKKKEALSIAEIAKKYGVKELSVGPNGPYIVTKEGIQIQPCPEEEFWVTVAAFSIVTKGKKLRSEYWERIGPSLEAYEKLKARNNTSYNPTNTENDKA